MADDPLRAMLNGWAAEFAAKLQEGIMEPTPWPFPTPTPLVPSPQVGMDQPLVTQAHF